MNLLRKIKDIIKQWLLKDELKEIAKIKSFKTDYDYLVNISRRSLSLLNEAKDREEKSYTLLDDCHKFMNSICDVGTDIGYRDVDHSWAVICVHGARDYIKFVDMRQSDIRAIVSFLKTFERANRVTDSPFHNSQIEDMILKM